MLNVLANNLLTIRKTKRMTQKEVADKVGITATALSAYEKAQREPSLSAISKLADFYGVSLDWLCGHQDSGSEIKAEFTRADAIRIISSLYENVPYTTIENEENEDGDLRPYYNTVITMHAGSDPWAYSYFVKYAALARLYKSGDIDKEVLEAWKDKKLKEKTYQMPFVEQIFTQVDDDELPF